MAHISAQMELDCSLEDALRTLTDPASFACFPGVSYLSLDDQTTHFEQILDLPLIGVRKQAMVVSVEGMNQTEEATWLSFSCRGELLSLSGWWRLQEANHRVHAHLTLDYTLSQELQRQAMDELRRHGPLPIRSDADAILTRAMEDCFQAQLSTEVEKYQENLRQRIEGRLQP
jgi:hypothetical protein